MSHDDGEKKGLQYTTKKPAKKATTEDMLRRLLKAEEAEFVGTSSRMHLRKAADEARSFLSKGKKT
jgi:hypothetical protein